VPFGLQCLSAAAAAMPSPSKVAPRTDDDIMDEEAGRARIRLAEESKARKKAQAALLKKQNTANLDKLKNQAAREDDDMTDEAAWKARAQLAAQSKARREAEQAAMKQREKEYKAKMASIVVRSDDDIMDEEAGKARIALAAESKAKKKAEKERLKAENKAYFDLIKNVKPRTDDDLLDDAQEGGKKPPSMTAAAIASRYTPPKPKAASDFRDGHITDWERKMASRGEYMDDFPWSSWAAPEWHERSRASKAGTFNPLLAPPSPPSPKTHTRKWLDWHSDFASM